VFLFLVSLVLTHLASGGQAASSSKPLLRLFERVRNAIERIVFSTRSRQ
jgi:hypothetical protein